MKHIFSSVIRIFWKKSRHKKYIRILARKENGELTIETAIVFVVIMILICSMIYFSLLLHDKVAIKSYAYSGLVEEADKEEIDCIKSVKTRIEKTPTFVLRPTSKISGDINKYMCEISEKEQSAMQFLNNIFTYTVGEQKVEVVRKMPIDKMYLFKALKDGIKK